MSKMNNYYLLGKSGLRISPLSLGTMTFGTEWGWGSPQETAREIFTKYLDAGGNFIDTADGYTNGTSEEMLGKFIQEQKNRNKIVLATKFTFNMERGNPNAGGNGRKNIMRAVESSLRRLQTDYIDLYWLHAWDTLAPVEETMQTLNSLVEQGKVRYIGLSDCPAWYVSRAQTLAQHNGWAPISAIQMEYNLTERNLELEYTSMVKELGMGICVWSPLAGGLLTGKYKRDQLGEGRLKATQDSPNPIMAKFIKNPKNWEIVDVLVDIAKQIEKPPALVALNFITKQPGVVSTIIGATKIQQLNENLASLDFEIPNELWSRLDEISKPFLPTPYMFFQTSMQAMISGGTNVTKTPPWY
jgi:aryl-alcohol dehydrogenase-like predicted oxidoreductase